MSIRYLTEFDVVSLVDLNDAVEALEQTCAQQGGDETVEIAKALATYADGSSLHALGSANLVANIGGFKTWVNTKRGACAVMTVFDIHSGRLLAMIEAGALGQLRTAAISGVATRWMAQTTDGEMALIGTGRQAMLQIAAVAAVSKLRRLRVYSPTQAKRTAFAAAARTRFPFPVIASDTLEEAVRDVPIVTLVTRAAAPFLHAAMLARGAHLNAVGAILPGNAEFAQDVFARAGLIAVDNLGGVQRNSREFIDRFGAATSDWSGIHTLGSLIRGDVMRPDGCDLTLFKAMGMGLSDLAIAGLVIQRADARNIGIEFADPRSAAPRWRTEAVAAE